MAIPSAIVWPVAARVDGRLAEWEEYTGLPFGAAGGDGAGARGEPSSGGSQDVTVWAGYDEKRIFFAASVAGSDCTGTWDGGLSPEALKAAMNGNSVQIAFGFGGRSSECVHKAEDPWYWKGMIRDTDYLYLVAPTGDEQAKVVCLHEPSMVWGESLLRGAKEVPEAKAALVNDGTTTRYEVSVPLSHLSCFGPDVEELRLGVVVRSGEKTFQLAESCGIPRYLASGGSFLPATEQGFLPNQVWWGVAR